MQRSDYCLQTFETSYGHVKALSM